MGTSSVQDRDFLATIISSRTLEIAIDWIQRNMAPPDVFTDKQLRDWADSIGLVEPE